MLVCDELHPSVAQLVERLTVVCRYCVSVYSEINWSPVRFWSFGLLFARRHTIASSIHSTQYLPTARSPAHLLTCMPFTVCRTSLLSLSLSCIQTGQPMLKRSKLGVCEPVPVCSLFCFVRIVEAFNGRGHRGRSIGRATQRRLWCAHDSKEQRAKSKEQRAKANCCGLRAEG